MKKVLFTCLYFAGIVNAHAQVQPLDTFIHHFTARNNFNGTILVENQGKTIYRKSFGLASFEWQVPNTPDTRYRVASITKAFTSTLILQLYEQGKLQLDTPFGKYLKDYQGPAGSKVTVRQLLNMTSGLRNMDDGTTLESALAKGVPQYQTPRTADQMIAAYGSDTLVTMPGKQFDYNNIDFILLGKIVENLTGQTFSQALKTRILQPLGMHNTGEMSQDTLIPKLASTYFMRPDLNRLVPDLPLYWQTYYASGNMFSTVDDLKLFCDALFGSSLQEQANERAFFVSDDLKFFLDAHAGSRLLKPATLKEFFVSGEGEYGLGVWVYKDFDIHHKMYTIIKRPGRIMGAQSMLFHIQETNQTIIILSNTGTISLDDFAAAIANMVVK